MPAAAFTTAQLLQAVADCESPAVADIWAEISATADCHKSTVWRALHRAKAKGLVDERDVADDGTVFWGLTNAGRDVLGVEEVNVETALAKVDTQPIDELVSALAAQAARLDELDLDALLGQQKAAEAAAEVVRRCHRAVDEAERGRRAFEAFALEARRHIGALLLELDAGQRGKHEKSERAKAIENVGLTKQDASRAIKLAEIDDETIHKVAERLDQQGKRLTVSGVLTAIKSVSESESYDSDEWGTPTEHIEAARRVMGPITWDLASNPVSQTIVRAKYYWTKSPLDLTEDGAPGPELLEQFAGIVDEGEGDIISFAIDTWVGVGDPAELADEIIDYGIDGVAWLNPPYSCSAEFVAALIKAYTAGRVKQAIILLNVCTDTAIQQRLLELSSARCWIAGRIAFLAPDGKPRSGNRYSQVAFYLGPDTHMFALHWRRFGWVDTFSTQLGITVQPSEEAC